MLWFYNQEWIALKDEALAGNKLPKKNRSGDSNAASAAPHFLPVRLVNIIWAELDLYCVFLNGISKDLHHLA